RLSAVRSDSGRYRRQQVAVAGDERDARAFGGQSDGNGLPEPLAGARDDGDAAVELSAHVAAAPWWCARSRISSARAWALSTFGMVRRLASPAVSIEISPMLSMRCVRPWSTRTSCTLVI